jgi:hypothetical protein
MSNVNKTRIIGSFEEVSIERLGVTNILAKVDTGAFSGALHCTDIKVIRRGIGKQRVLKFTPLGDPRLATETTEFASTYVRSATGHRMRRHIIVATLTIRGETYTTKLGVSDRSDMRCPMLLGRRFLRENDVLVDVRINAQYDDEGERTR